jgi:ABC-type methionine transport system ATPase subunit
VARALARRPRYLVVRDPDGALSEETVGLLGLLRMVARSDRLGVVVSLGDGAVGRGVADRVLLLREGRLLPERHLRIQRRPTVLDVDRGA